MGILDFWSGLSSASSSSDSLALVAPLEATAAAAPPNKFVTELNPTGIKPCCACPDSKARRDDCFLANGPGSESCAELVAAHRACMASLGFKI